ncbi:hypothetical protein AXK12_04480 [Cephaloticoccus capnophilus]|uniref:Gamma-butyrobetaine hydroxylase-like N-terminal domain-containing protein n=1 Tax=Cephaloticoccus capnophilus TaxID=1548208 RepID=A0A139SNK4_9BACT|nr:gamma-butyrobetaine hydroxylase-like domain-containing protein [Cephaloticoccus capnophilus]KXU36080.1 hypothetical protein AXK12_04480 [Cephaloticoccus capnophilus]
MERPTNIQLIGKELGIVWSDGCETYYDPARLRAASPSAQAQGERDILGQVHGGEGPTTARDHSGVTIHGWQIVGNYAVRFEFSDGHRTGLYSFDFLRELAAKP